MVEVTLISDSASPAFVVNTEYRNIDRVFDSHDAKIVKDLVSYLTRKSREVQCRVDGIDYIVRSV